MEDIKPRLIIIAGAPGSGKSTLARKIKHHIRTYYHNPGNVLHYETDMFFYDKEGKYHFDKAKAPEAHSKCQYVVEQGISEGCYVIVSNTFTHAWERKFYFDLARKYNVAVRYIHCLGEFKNIHDIPEDKVKTFRESYEPLSENEIQDITIIINQVKEDKRW